MNPFVSVFGFISKTVASTPGVGSAHFWAANAATNSKVAREILRMIIYACMGCMIYSLYMAFQLIIAGKLNATAGTVITGAFALFGGILTVTVPAFVVALNATNAPPTPASPPSSTPPTDVAP
jgi:FtsH-binding integral membrane protein